MGSLPERDEGVSQQTQFLPPCLLASGVLGQRCHVAFLEDSFPVSRPPEFPHSSTVCQAEMCVTATSLPTRVWVVSVFPPVARLQ